MSIKEQGCGIGVVSVSFRDRAPSEIMGEMKRCGLSLVEWGSDIHAPCNDIARLEEISEMQQQLNICCSSYGTYFRLGVTPIDELIGYINAAKTLGTDVLRLWCGNKSGDAYTDSEREDLFCVCREAAKIAESNRVFLCMECHIKTFTERAEDALLLMRAVDSPNFRMYWQPSQWRSAEENLSSANALAPYVQNVHVFNWHGDEKHPLADAEETWRKYLSALPKSCNLLLEFMPDGQLSSLCREAEALKKISGVYL